MEVDFSKPLEAVHSDGRIGTVEPHAIGFTIEKPAYAGIAGTMYIDAYKGGWRSDGSPMDSRNPWTIRNTQPKSPPIPDDIAARAMAVVRMAAKGQCAVITARAILSDLEPVSADVLTAREIVAQVHIANGYSNHDRTDLDAGKLDNESPMRIALAAIAKGRQMQKDGE